MQSVSVYALCMGMFLGGPSGGEIERIVLDWNGASLPLLSYEEIEVTCTQMLSSRPSRDASQDVDDRVKWLLRRGQARYYLLKASEAFGDFSECYRLHPDDGYIAFEYARCAIRLGEDAAEVDRITRRLAATAKFRAHGHYLLAYDACFRKDFDSAIKAFDTAVEAAPHWMHLRCLRSLCAQMLEQYEKALVDLESALNWPHANPNNSAQLRFAYGGVLTSLGRHEQATAVMVQAFRESCFECSAVIQCEMQKPLWGYLTTRGEHAQSAQLAKMRIDIAPEDPLGFRQAALSIAALGDTKTALTFAEKALEMDSDASTSWGTLARVYYVRGDYDNARRCFDRALTTRASNVDPDDVYRFAFLLATCPDEQYRDGEDAVWLFRQVPTGEEILAVHPPLLALHAICLAEAGDMASAVRLMEQAVRNSAHDDIAAKRMESLKQLFAQGRAYRHDPLAPDKQLFQLELGVPVRMRYPDRVAPDTSFERERRAIPESDNEATHGKQGTEGQ